ncbi:MAG: type IV pilus assembly protein PilM [Trichodesmium sp. St16_bin4-tuft]|nr:type IV pilus assembly protein PilM [Trichodesmium sp. St5_bin8]MDE5079726.1 type IV pilus assembly protein PilM [Trichodesmium sp. St2_bin6]MDE5100470.1 type IV pilus assembly protein PilM [Trichodesmium sp. St16_bin4-tuft]MDE5101665.1 type IV pilus assembly protein PilM [Trichodesmium sp. St19_bin2]
MLNYLKNLFQTKQPGIGIEVSPEKINIAKIQKQGDQLKLVNFATAQVPENVFSEGQIIDIPTMSELIESIIADNNIKIRRVATAISAREAVTRVIPVPAELNDQELQDYMNQEAGLYLPFPREQADVDYQKLGNIVDSDDDIEKVQVALVATRKEITDAYIEAFSEAGLVIDILEVSNFALIRTVKDILQQYGPQEATVIADLEFDSTELAIVVDGIPQFNRTIPIGTYQMQSSLNEAMNLPPTRDTTQLLRMTIPVLDTMGFTLDKVDSGTNALLKVLAELGDELRRSIDFYLNQFEDLEVAQLLLTGPGAAIGQVDDFFMQRLSLPASKVDPIEVLGLETEVEIPPEQRYGLGIVLGLGLREV